MITVASLVCLVVLGSFAAYYLARTQPARLRAVHPVPARHRAAVPARLIPLYRLVSDLGLLGTYTAMVLFYTGLQMPFTMFLYTGFIRALPARVRRGRADRRRHALAGFTRVVFPLLRPITGTVMILNAVFIWNDFFTPLLYLGGSRIETVPVGVFAFVGQYISDWGWSSPAWCWRRCRSWSSSCCCSDT